MLLGLRGARGTAAAWAAAWAVAVPRRRLRPLPPGRRRHAGGGSSPRRSSSARWWGRGMLFLGSPGGHRHGARPARGRPRRPARWTSSAWRCRGEPAAAPARRRAAAAALALLPGRAGQRRRGPGPGPPGDDRALAGPGHRVVRARGPPVRAPRERLLLSRSTCSARPGPLELTREPGRTARDGRASAWGRFDYPIQKLTLPRRHGRPLRRRPSSGSSARTARWHGSVKLERSRAGSRCRSPRLSTRCPRAAASAPPHHQRQPAQPPRRGRLLGGRGCTRPRGRRRNGGDGGRPLLRRQRASSSTTATGWSRCTST